MVDDSIHILLIEDDSGHTELIQRAFEERGNGVCLTAVSTLAEARACLMNLQPALIISDWRLPDGEGSELLSEEHQHLPCPPIVIMTSYGNEHDAVESMKAGALDYIVKSAESMMDMPHIAERALHQWQILQEQKRMQRALAEQEAQFRLLAENSSDMISRHNMQGDFLYVSPACRTLLGYEPAELTGQPVIPLIYPEDTNTFLELLSSPTRESPTAALSYRARHKNGGFVWLETTVKIIQNPNSEAIEVQASSRDITERKQSQVELQLAHMALQDAYDRTIEGWVRALDLRDQETEGHTQRVTEMTIKLARRLGCTDEELVHIRRGALLHDIGKMGIPDQILQKPGPLTEPEREIMRRHPQYAYQMLSPIQYLNQALSIPYYHHERWDGSGYPHGMKGEEIPIFARLFAVVDVWDALSTDRAYRKSLPAREVIEYLEEEAGQLFDSDIVKIFLDMIANQ